MQLKSFFTEEEIRQHDDPLFLTCHPLNKLKMVSTVIFNASEGLDAVPFETFRSEEVFALGEVIEDAADELDFLVKVANDLLNAFEERVKSLEARVKHMETHPTAASFLSDISQQEAKTLLEFMQLHLPGCKQLNPRMSWEESHTMGRLFEKVRAVLYCLAGKGGAHED